RNLELRACPNGGQLCPMSGRNGETSSCAGWNGEQFRGFLRFLKRVEAAKLLGMRLIAGAGERMMYELRQQKLDSFGRAPAVLSAALRPFPKKMWLYKPEAERWSIHEIILHLADSEASGYVRCRRLIAEPGNFGDEIDASRWAGSLGYFYQSTREALEIIRRLRKMTYQLLARLPEAVWSRRVESPLDGNWSLEDWVERQERHIPYHIEQMKQNFFFLMIRRPPRKPASPSPRSSAPSRMISISAGI